MAITKTDFMRGMQCRKMLWLDKHKPGLRVIPPEVQERLDAGTAFGDLAMGMFGLYEEMTVFRPGTTIPDKKAMLEKTQDALSRDVPVICEAAFSNYNNYCAADILRKTENGYDIYEVKNAPEVREQFIRDAAFQHYIICRSGLRIGRIFIVIHGPDEGNPFVPVEVTKEAKGYFSWIIQKEEASCGLPVSAGMSSSRSSRRFSMISLMASMASSGSLWNHALFGSPCVSFLITMQAYPGRGFAGLNCEIALPKILLKSFSVHMIGAKH